MLFVFFFFSKLNHLPKDCCDKNNTQQKLFFFRKTKKKFFSSPYFLVGTLKYSTRKKNRDFGQTKKNREKVTCSVQNEKMNSLFCCKVTHENILGAIYDWAFKFDQISLCVLHRPKVFRSSTNEGKFFLSVK